MHSFLANFITFLFSFIFSAITTPQVRKLALKHNYIAFPRDDRWHKKPTGLLGGVGIYFSMMAGWLIMSFILTDADAFILPMLPVALGGTAIFFLGLMDDIFEINPQYKLIGQVIVASFFVLFGFQLGWFTSQTANLVVSIFWIVGITNAFNLLDNMDGLSAGIACISGFFLFLWLQVMPGSHLMVKPVHLFLSAYLGSILGFLIYNFSPASVFMGDAGSLLIGFIIACLSIVEVPSHVQGSTLFNQLSVIVVPCFILFIPILDTAFVSLMRRLFSRSIFQGGQDHSSHRMVAIGFSEKKAVLTLYLFAAISGVLALCIYPLDFGISAVIIVLYLLLVLFFWIYLANVKVYSDKFTSEGVQIPVFIKAAYWRTLFAILLDLILITIAYYSAYLLRFEWEVGPDFAFFLKSLPILFACQIFSFYIFGVYRRLWWGSRLGDLDVYVKGVTAGTVLAILVLLFLYRFQSFSRAVFVIYWGVMLIFVLFSRFFFKILDEWGYRENRNGTPTLIYGAGIGGLMVVQEIETNHSLGLSIVGFIDDNPLKAGKQIHGYPVLGGHEQLSEIVKKNQIKEIVVSFRHNGSEKKKEIAKWAGNYGLDVSVSLMRLVIGK